MGPAGLREYAVVSDELKNILEQGQFRGDIRFDEPLSGHTSLKIGGPVDIMVFPQDPLSLKNVLRAASRGRIPLFVIGAGTNILAGDGPIEGIAVSLKAFRSIEITRQGNATTATVFAGAGTPLGMLIGFARKNGFSGLEPLAGIPGTVGGAVYMNAGSFGTEVKDLITSIGLISPEGEIEVLQRDQLTFSYRRSHLPHGSVILSANFALAKDDPAEVARRMDEYMARKKAAQPLAAASAGCVFKNPEGDAAGRLIEAAGCKGMREGDIEVSTVHANYFINRGRGTCRDFLALMADVAARVRHSSGIELEPEVKLIGVTGDWRGGVME